MSFSNFFGFVELNNEDLVQSFVKSVKVSLNNSIKILYIHISRKLAQALKKSFKKMLENIIACLIIVQITRNFVICWKYTSSSMFR